MRTPYKKKRSKRWQAVNRVWDKLKRKGEIDDVKKIRIAK